MLAISNDSSEPMYGVPLAALLGLLITFACFRTRSILTAFVLTFGLCIFVAGAAQLHMASLTGHVLGGSDAFGFFSILRQRPPFLTIEQIQRYNDGAISIYLWQYVYRATHGLGLSHLPWIGITVNSIMIGWTVSITIATAKLIPLFRDERRVYWLVVLLATNGLLLLSGALFLREAYACLINAILVWCYSYSIKNRTVASFIVCAIATALGCWFMWYLRDRAVALLVVLWLAYAGMWAVGGHFSGNRFATLLALAAIVSVAGISILEAAGVGRSFMIEEAEKYSSFSAVSARSDSLGARFVTGQPLPIRIFTGTLFQVLYPVPLWANLSSGSWDYHLIKTWQGLYFVAIFPFFLTGAWFALKGLNLDTQMSRVLVSLALYSLIALVAIAVTSTETRHFAQFTAPLIVVACSVDRSKAEQIFFLRRISTAWFGGVLFIHFVWVLLRVF